MDKESMIQETDSIKVKSGFEYVKGTELGEYYVSLTTIEAAYRKETYYDCAALIRKETEIIMKRIVLKYELKDNIISKFRIFGYEQIKQYLLYYSDPELKNKLNINLVSKQIANIQNKGNKGTHGELEKKLSRDDVTEILKNLHEVCIWYLKYITEEVDINKNIPFVNPNDIEDEVTIIIKKSQQEIMNINSRLKNKENIIRENEEQIKNKELKLEESRRKINELKKNIKVQNDRFLEEKRKLANILENEINRIKNSSITMESELRNKEDIIEQLEIEKKSIEEESINTNIRFIQYKNENMQRIADAVNELKFNKKKIEEMEKTLKFLEEEKNLIVKEKERIQQTAKKQDQQIAEFRNEINKTNAIIVEKENILIDNEKQIDMLKKYLAEVKNKVNRELNENIELKRKVKASEDKCNVVKANYELLQQEYYKLNTKIKEYQDVLEERKNESNTEKQLILSENIKYRKKDIEIQEEVFDKHNDNIQSLGCESESDLKTLTKIIDAKISNGRYEDFYRAFLGLKERNLRNIYVLLTEINMTSVIVNKAKESFSESDNDFMSEYLLNKSMQFDAENDDNIRLKIYYELIKKTESKGCSIISVSEFIKSIDVIIEKAYMMICMNHDFTAGNSKLEDISLYYCRQIIENIKLKYQIVDAYISEDTSERIYDEIWNLDINTKKIIYNQLNLDKHDVTEVKKAIIQNPFDVMNVVISLRNDKTFYIIARIMKEVCTSLNFNSSVFTKVSSLSNMFNEFIMDIFGNGKSLLAPLCIMQVMLYSIDMKNEKTDLTKYTSMLKIWVDEKRNYDQIKKENINDKMLLEKVNNEKSRNMSTLDKVERALNTLKHEKCEKFDVFSNSVINSDKARYLPSYIEYAAALKKHSDSENKLESVKKEKSFFKNLFNKDMWKEQSAKLVNELNIKNIEKKLIAEAEQSSHFNYEYSVILETDEKIKRISEMGKDLKNKIKQNNTEIKEFEEKIYYSNNILDDFTKRFPDFML